MAIKANLFIDQGTDFSAIVDLIDSFDNVFDLTGYTAYSQMRKNYASTTAYDFTCSDNNTLGQIELKMSSSITKDLEPGRYLYDIEIVYDDSGDVTRVAEGVVTVTPGITRTF